MSFITVLGGGQIGSIAAADLAERHQVTVIDKHYTDRKNYVRIDITPDRIKEYLLENTCDHVVCCLPGSLAYDAIKACIESGVSVTDVSFLEEDLSTLDKLASQRGVCVVHDCGFAPGIPNVIVAHEAKDRPLGLRDVRIYVGGMAANSAINKLGYVATWSVDDLFEEFRRDARFKVQHKIKKAHPLHRPIELVQVGSFIFESFISDGLRSMIKMHEVENMVERTLRWPGHVQQIKDIIDGKGGTFKEEISACKGRDMVVLKVDVDGRSFQMLLYGDEEMTAMARATAGGLVAATEVVLKWNFPVGVLPPERFFRDNNKYTEYMKELSNRGLFING